jgi:hypothetical protein
MSNQTEALRQLLDAHNNSATLLGALTQISLLTHPDGEVADYADVVEAVRWLHQHELAHKIWLEKTEWVHETAQPQELGMHRADVLRQRIERLHALNRELLEMVHGQLEYSALLNRN